jgi:hypothetical protein
MIDYKQALAVCRTDPEATARMFCEFSRELDQLKAEVATLKAESATLPASFWETPSFPPSTPPTCSCSPVRTPAEDHVLYLDKLPACQNPVHPVNPLRKRPEQL